MSQEFIFWGGGGGEVLITFSFCLVTPRMEMDVLVDEGSDSEEPGTSTDEQAVPERQGDHDHEHDRDRELPRKSEWKWW